MFAKETAGPPPLCILVGVVARPVPRSRVNSDRAAEQRPALFVFDAASALLISVNGAGHTMGNTPYLTASYATPTQSSSLADRSSAEDRSTECVRRPRRRRGKQRFAKFSGNLNWNGVRDEGAKIDEKLKWKNLMLKLLNVRFYAFDQLNFF